MRVLSLRFGLVAALIVLVADQITKHLVLSHLGALPYDQRYMTLLPFLDVVLVGNRGVTFGMFNDGGSFNAIIFAGIALAIVAGLLWWLRSVSRWWVAIAIGMIIGGAIGNLSDRLRLGAVVDFIDFFIGSWHWYTFNVADAGICVGVGILLLDSLAGRAESPK
jgi:signal peptidase II